MQHVFFVKSKTRDESAYTRDPPMFDGALSIIQLEIQPRTVTSNHVHTCLAVCFRIASVFSSHDSGTAWQTPLPRLPCFNSVFFFLPGANIATWAFNPTRSGTHQNPSLSGWAGAPESQESPESPASLHLSLAWRHQPEFKSFRLGG